ncbi:MAG: hypothetical protein ACRDRT_17365 [Pseudonocardiaceae bacterium]
MGGVETSAEIGVTETQLRARAVRRARGSSLLEGIVLSPEAHAVEQRFIDGAIDADELVEEMAKLPLA